MSLSLRMRISLKAVCKDSSLSIGENPRVKTPVEKLWERCHIGLVIDRGAVT